jgi:hypothetical protein
VKKPLDFKRLKPIIKKTVVTILIGFISLRLETGNYYDTWFCDFGYRIGGEFLKQLENW